MKKHKDVLFVIFCAVLTVAVCAVVLAAYAQENRRITIRDKADFTEGDLSEITCEIESVETQENGDLLISGWCLQEGVTWEFYNYGNDATRSETYNNMHLCLVNGDTVYVLPTKLCQRNDVNDLYDDGIDYHNCGFLARLTKDNSALEGECELAMEVVTPDGEDTLYLLLESLEEAGE